MAADNLREILFQILEVPNSHLLQQKLQHHAKRLEAVNCADAKIDARRLGEVARLDRNFGNRKSETHGLGNDLGVENKIVRIQQEWHFCKQ